MPPFQHPWNKYLWFLLPYSCNYSFSGSSPRHNHSPWPFYAFSTQFHHPFHLFHTFRCLFRLPTMQIFCIRWTASFTFYFLPLILQFHDFNHSLFQSHWYPNPSFQQIGTTTLSSLGQYQSLWYPWKRHSSDRHIPPKSINSTHF